VRRLIGRLPGVRVLAGAAPDLRTRVTHYRANLADLSDAHQVVVIKTEESIRRSRWLISQSQRLINLLESRRL
jgi:hypothetical protein